MRRAFGDATLPSVCTQGEAKGDLEKHLPKNPKPLAIAAQGSPVPVPVPACIPNALGRLLAFYKPFPLPRPPRPSASLRVPAQGKGAGKGSELLESARREESGKVPAAAGLSSQPGPSSGSRCRGWLRGGSGRVSAAPRQRSSPALTTAAAETFQPKDAHRLCQQPASTFWRIAPESRGKAALALFLTSLGNPRERRCGKPRPRRAEDARSRQRSASPDVSQPHRRQPEEAEDLSLVNASVRGSPVHRLSELGVNHYQQPPILQLNFISLPRNLAHPLPILCYKPSFLAISLNFPRKNKFNL
ncbi:uncharacterized protein LOC118173980 [Oxyura jamaicensis]|uniref:uncharacterized protein LOC118173980 n=1 Tax=Oxyura jamaicensis TaxID=8884 RepID=UPI0015A669F7|nr:uncharacterized protein LOC118173980 [Oxyura jamaicensis]